MDSLRSVFSNRQNTLNPKSAFQNLIFDKFVKSRIHHVFRVWYLVKHFACHIKMLYH
ncbi:hypothetical protein D1AOALGA4SA_363 [Olavius algarvensis Delta 1 endosymbiont]|nr:hypothetical protein D1AOALGA4SA_363 [Olavius algarvensis Delta 1 endosymbiont]